MTRAHRKKCCDAFDLSQLSITDDLNLAFDALVHGKKSSSASLPDDMEEALQRLESEFTIQSSKLKEIISRFQEELQDGRYFKEYHEHSPMNLTWVMGWPSGRETGSFLTLDLGGTNLRVCWVELQGRGKETKLTQDQYKLSDEVKTGDAEQLWSYVAESLESFIKKHNIGGASEQPIPFGFTFSYPASQHYIDHGILQTWTKGLDIKGVEGNDAAAQLRQAMQERSLPIELIALINDTTGAMIASAYRDPQTIAGAIFGTGCNAAYMEQCKSIPKLSNTNMLENQQMAINCEYGAFDNAHKVLPRTRYDIQIDQESPRPGEQTFEKLSAGNYMGEIFRLAVVDMHDQGLLFKNQDISNLRQGYLLDTAFLSQVENDESAAQRVSKDMFKEKVEFEPTTEEMLFAKRLAIAIATRGARLCTCGIAAICKKTGTTKGHVAADGSVANKHPHFKQRWANAMAEVMDWSDDRTEDPITITSAEDGSGIGAAIIAAMTMERMKKGDMVGIQSH
ncbi:Hexokinase [Pseudocercospora fuligena]|uniref:Phosphotransferase n=1 Tax=Pseudocercospora fuligena TaxID=685502 RepID=A0A8H6RDY9_9PEZI|nr:Hexokinase [Pseudocercospora fuligena]